MGLIKAIPGSGENRIARQGIMRTRLFDETRIFLNNSNCKWVSIGVKPTSPYGKGDIKNFVVEIYLGGEKTVPMALGGVVGFTQLMRQIREIDFFQNLHPDVSNYFRITFKNTKY